MIYIIDASLSIRSMHACIIVRQTDSRVIGYFHANPDVGKSKTPEIVRKAGTAMVIGEQGRWEWCVTNNIPLRA